MLIQTTKSDYWKNYYATHWEERKAQQRAYYWRNRETSIASSKRYYWTNREEQLEYHKRHQQQNKEKRLVQNKEWLKHNPEKRRQYAKIYRESHQNAYRKYQREYQYSAKRQLYRKKPNYQAKQKIITARYRTRKQLLEATLTLEQWQAIVKAYKGKCAYCGRKLENLTQDHVLPIVYGGAYIASNIVPACRSCNSSKGAKLPSIIPPIRLFF